ncbi:DUF3857 domain-containing protein [Flavobacterium sp.]|uniref:DUF3857 domain-containing protein n=1 Tax=Flavobacterium sp. TaxID=239 RepID=UPI0040486F31
MKIKIFLFLLTFSQIFSQNDFSPLTVSKELKEKANSVVRYQNIEVTIKSQKSYRIRKRKIITVLNEYGLKNVDAREYYSSSESVNSIEAIIYDLIGKEVKKIKRKDFKDQSVADGFSVLTDNRIIYLDYTPTQYPFTIEYISDVTSSNTAFIPSWYPIDDYYESVQKSVFKLGFIPELGFKYKELNFEGYDIKKTEESNSISYSVENLVAEKPEDYSPSFKEIVPNVIFGLENFSLEGVEGSAKSWEEFGKIWYKELVYDDSKISAETVEEINKITNNIKDPIEKAKVIYKYVQNKTRYVSIQLGIGGWKPMSAKDVDRLGYGDCKALSNYTRILLENVGVKSFYTVIYGDTNKRDLDKDFVSLQGNHAILTLPYNDKNYFLECTSQTNPFAFGGDFTDDRYALIIKEEGAFVLKTNQFKTLDSYQNTIGNYSITENGELNGGFESKSGGIQYDNKAFLGREKDKNKLYKHYKERYGWINGLKINSLEVNENQENIEFVEKLSISSSNYCTSAGNSLYFPVNAFNRSENIPKKYRNRKYDFELSRGFQDQDVVEVSLPVNYDIEYLPEELVIENKFGKYSFKLVKLENNKLKLIRILAIDSGSFSKEEYEEYRAFREQIAKHDNSKIVLTKK